MVMLIYSKGDLVQNDLWYFPNSVVPELVSQYLYLKQPSFLFLFPFDSSTKRNVNIYTVAMQMTARLKSSI